MKKEIDAVNKYLRNQKENRAEFERSVIPSMKCKDGFTMSVQASSGHYCNPQVDTALWEAVEVGFPSEKESLLTKYAEDSDTPTKTVYGWVPIETVAKIIAKHGGLVE